MAREVVSGVLAQGDSVSSQQADDVQLGDNTHEVIQTATASSGDADGGQVSGVVTSAGGTADVVLANTSTEADAASGDGEFTAIDTTFTGLNADGVITVL